VSHQGNVVTQATAGRSAGAETPERTTQRVLDVLDGVCRFGPITLSDLVSRLDIPRGAVWRSLDALRQKGWVRMRHGDRAFELCPSVPGLFGQAQAARPEVEALMPIFTRLAESGPVHVDLGLFTARGAFRLVETTRKQGYSGQSLSLTDDDIALAAQLHLPPTDLVRHLTTFVEQAGAEERQVISSGEHARTLRRLRPQGVVWQEDGSSAAFGRRGWPGVALRVELWRYSRLRAAELRDLVTKIVATEAD
jgi:DNA-binding IclR family transcriptional regulator